MTAGAFYLLSAGVSLALSTLLATKLWRKSPRTIIIMLVAGLATTAYSLYLALTASSGLIAVDLGPHAMANAHLTTDHGALELAIAVAATAAALLAAAFLLLAGLSWISGRSRSKPHFWRWYWRRATWAWPLLTGYFFVAAYPTALVKGGLWQPGPTVVHGLEAAYITLLACLVITSIGTAHRIWRGVAPLMPQAYLSLAALVGACSPLMIPFTSPERAAGDPLAALFACFFVAPPLAWALLNQWKYL